MKTRLASALRLAILLSLAAPLRPPPPPLGNEGWRLTVRHETPMSMIMQ